MTYVVVPDKTNGDVFSELMWDTHIKDNLNKGVMRPIAETVLGGAAASISFSSIAADWSHLMIVLQARGDTAATSVEVLARFNGDTGANYDREYLDALAAVVGAAMSEAGTSGRVGHIAAASSPASHAGCVEGLIQNYAGATFFKTSRWRSGSRFAASNVHLAESFVQWRSAVAITQVTLLPSAGNFIAGSRATLYGMGGV